VWGVGCGVCGVCGVCGGVGVVSPCVRTFQGLHSVRLWTPTIFRKTFKGCPSWDQAFSEKGALNVHVNSVHKNITRCDKTFSQKGTHYWSCKQNTQKS
jgi:hypothetical protein